LQAESAMDAKLKAFQDKILAEGERETKQIELDGQ
jgi:hypothetical protein